MYIYIYIYINTHLHTNIYIYSYIYTHTDLPPTPLHGGSPHGIVTDVMNFGIIGIDFKLSDQYP